MLNKEQGRTAIIFMFVPPPKGWPPSICCKVVFLGTLNKSEKKSYSFEESSRDWFC